MRANRKKTLPIHLVLMHPGSDVFFSAATSTHSAYLRALMLVGSARPSCTVRYEDDDEAVAPDRVCGLTLRTYGLKIVQSLWD